MVVYKANLAMARGAEVKRRIFQPLIAKGYVAVVFGGIEQGKMIVENPRTEDLACTGSVFTYGKFAWGNQDKIDQVVLCVGNDSRNPGRMFEESVPISVRCKTRILASSTPA